MEDSREIANMGPNIVSFYETFCFDQSLYHKTTVLFFLVKKSKLKVSGEYDLYYILRIREKIKSKFFTVVLVLETKCLY